MLPALPNLQPINKQVARLAPNPDYPNEFMVTNPEVLPVELVECGCCGAYHPKHDKDLIPDDRFNAPRYGVECRDNSNRYHGAEDYEQRRGKPAIEIWLEDLEDEE